jgi:MFS family permease
VLRQATHTDRFLRLTTVYSVGTGMWLPASTLFLINVAGLSPASVGVGIAVAGIAGVVATVYAGTIAHAFGPVRTLVGCFTLTVTGLLAYTLVDSLWTLLVVASVVRVADRVARPLLTHVAATLVGPAERVDFLARVYAAINLGLTIGALAAGALLAFDSAPVHYLLLVVNAAAYVAAALLLARISVTAPESADVGFRAVLRDLRYLALSVLNVPMVIFSSTITIGLPLWLKNGANAPNLVVGLLYAVNTVLIVLFQVKVGRVVTSAVTAGRAYLLSGVLFAAGCVCWGLAGGRDTTSTIVLLTAGLVLITVGEIFICAGQWAVSVGLADEANRAHFLSVWNVGVSAQDVIGPLLITVLLTAYGATGWALLGLVVAVAGMMIHLVVRNARTVALEER